MHSTSFVCFLARMLKMSGYLERKGDRHGRPALELTVMSGNVGLKFLKSQLHKATVYCVKLLVTSKFQFERPQLSHKMLWQRNREASRHVAV